MVYFFSMATENLNFGVAKLNIKPKNPGATVIWNLVSSSGIFPLEDAEETGRIKIIRKDNDAIYIQFLKNPGFFKLLRFEVRGLEKLDLERYDDATLLIINK